MEEKLCVSIDSALVLITFNANPERICVFEMHPWLLPTLWSDQNHEELVYGVSHL